MEDVHAPHRRSIHVAPLGPATGPVFFTMPLSKTERMEIAKRLYMEGQSLKQAASVAGVSVSGLWKYLVRHGLERRKPGAQPKLTKYAKQQILHDHLEYGIGISALARRFNVSKETIRRVFAEYGKMTYSLAQIKKVQALRRDREVYNRVIDLYRKGFPVKEIAKTVKTSQRRVSRIVRSFIQQLPYPVLSEHLQRSSDEAGSGKDNSSHTTE